MRTWHLINLGDPLLAPEALGRIETIFAAEYLKAGKPLDMALFFRHESEGRLHCELKLYFSPAAEAVARVAGAEPCPAPAPRGLSLSVGAEESWPLLFPEHSA